VLRTGRRAAKADPRGSVRHIEERYHHTEIIVEEQKANNSRRKKVAIGVFTLVALVAAVTLFFYLRYKATHISTDDAFIDGRIHTIAPKIAGTVKAIHVNDNQPVKKGDLLVEIDPADYEVKVREAESGVQAEKGKLAEVEARKVAAQNQLQELKAAAETAKAHLDLQEANLAQAALDLKRAENLYRREAISKERHEKARTAYDVSEAQVRAAREQVNQAGTAIETQKSVIRQIETSMNAQASAIREKEAKFAQAELNYSYTDIRAPSDGYVTKKSVEQGNQVQTGQPLMAVVALDDLWVTANYKETQLQKIKPGRRVTIQADTYPGKRFEGKVDSIMSGTGAVFSLFPPENATGNYVKVVQRIPVKILLNKDTDPQHVLRIGMSVVPTVIIE
jgi:membrane fusion protein (multidrug efflux system)